jgi:DNA-binding winged helix-turn-helix (wHTH) protein/tetratricopeptide (TPR) repeat protein
MLKLTDLARRADFGAGPLRISPARRLIEGPTGKTTVEPIVLKVFLLLLDAGGSVVTRDELFGSAWGGVFVGDDSLNRAIARVRKIAAQTAPGLFEIETIPRTGYRLTGKIVETLELTPENADVPPDQRVSRRLIIGSSAAAAAVVATGGALWWSRARVDPRFEALIDKAEDALRHEDADEKTAQLLQQAIAIRPDSARAWGLLALVKSALAQGGDPKDALRAVNDAEKTAQRALSLDPKEPNALLAMFELQGASLEWITRDQRLRQIIAIDPTNVIATMELTLLTAAAGLLDESWNWNERALALEPLSVDFLGKRALKLWIAGRVSDADKVIDQARALYPQHPWSWWVRFFIFALTGRPRSAQAMVDAEPRMIGNPAQASLWRDCLPALDQPSALNIGKARSSCIEAGRLPGFIATQAALIMCALGDVDTAYDIADALLFSRGPIVRGPQSGSRGAGEDANWRISTQWMWTPPAVVMRADRRFPPLCEGVGLVEYWRARGVKADSLRGRV